MIILYIFEQKEFINTIIFYKLKNPHYYQIENVLKT